jgi:RNA polymerase sigma-70 factor (ECF subfamily)
MIDWNELLRREGSAVWRTVYRLVRNQADAEECFQETFLAALEIANRATVENWPGLLQRLATARGIDRLRKRLRRMRREEIADLALAETAEPGPAQQAETAELAAALRWALAQLPVRQAELFCLHELSDWSYQDIAEQFAMSTSAVGVTLHRTRHKLQELLKKQNCLPAALDQNRPA